MGVREAWNRIWFRLASAVLQTILGGFSEEWYPEREEDVAKQVLSTWPFLEAVLYPERLLEL